ncbi:M1 family metallopeptidase [Nonomuraea aridisoli]|uniref:Aminopeptidase N n=1 Tax=Nonomuraea aridisoli TaxID=2070368 RepID=A0A2W2DJ66_9ACTN|nr:M1 family metallopeptidase [Nonomuraea aridisoli]PZG04029.1 metallopeptidase [Nonomuraea aridisoli]
MRFNRRGVVALVVLGSVVGCSLTDEPTPPAVHHTEAAYRPGAPGIGDPDFPQDGNGGYDVAHYDLDVDYTPATKRLEGVATIRAAATQGLSSFNLDLAGLHVRKVRIDDEPATFSRQGDELTVRPGQPIDANDEFTVEVTYDGVPNPAKDTGNLGTFGFMATSDGAFVASEPDGSKTWFPSNDHPADKATYSFEITVPAGLTALANGEQVGRPKTAGGRTTFRWRERHPMATYLATATLGKFDLRQGKSAAGIPTLAATDPAFKSGLDRLYTSTAEITDHWAKVFGPYPFSSTGGVIDNYTAGYALENQTKPLYGGFDPDEVIVAHELAHQWFGNSLTIWRWKDLWLNEGFATYAEWLWSEHKGRKTVEEFFTEFNDRPESDPMWSYPPGRAKPDDLFNQSVYTRGAMTLHALRRSIGDETFFKLLRTWAADHRYGHVTTEKFIDLAERMSGKDLNPLFDAWLFQPRKPAA